MRLLVSSQQQLGQQAASVAQLHDTIAGLSEDWESRDMDAAMTTADRSRADVIEPAAQLEPAVGAEP